MVAVDVPSGLPSFAFPSIPAHLWPGVFGAAAGIGAVVLGPLPVVPLLAALPATGTPAGWVGGLMALPPLVAAWSAFRALRGRLLTWDRILLAGCGGGLAAGFAFAVLASLSGGSAGPGRMRFVGPFTRDVLVHSVTACGIGALLGASVLALLVWRSTRTPRSTPTED